MDVEVVDVAAVRPKPVKASAKAAKTAKAAVPVVREEPGATGGVKYVARRSLKVGANRYKPGDVVPEAASWTRVEAWVRSGYIDEVEV